MTPKQVVTINVKELKEVELRCECSASIRLPLPLKNKLPGEQKCLGCGRTMWMDNSDTWAKIANLLDAIRDWAGFEQTILSLSFVVDGVIGQKQEFLGKN